jgi:peptidoglycan/xylan/chitin deacetylase (PgdA/CDA1 family)
MMKALNWGKIISPLRYHAGFAATDWRRRARRSGLVAVLCYHRVVDGGLRPAGQRVDQGVTVATLQAQLRFMLRHFEPVAPSQVLESRPTPRFAVTFDDGYLDNHDLAAPLLRRLGIPAGFYVVSDLVGTTRRFWWDRLLAILQNSARPTLDLHDWLSDPVVAAWPKRIPLDGGPAIDAALALISPQLSAMLPDRVESLVDRLADLLGARQPQVAGETLMDWPHLRALAGQGFEIGAHSASHLNLGLLVGEALAMQVGGAKARIEAQIGAPVKTFAYPYGQKQALSPAAFEAVRRAGYTLAFTAMSGVVSADADAAALPRVALNWPMGFACAHNIAAAITA